MNNENDILVVSSYDESCGNAYFTRAVVDGLSKFYSCDALGLNLKLTQATDNESIKLADEHVRDICRSIEKARAVNIQVEPQLFGTRPEDVMRRLDWLFTANKRTSVTMHNTRVISPKFPLRPIMGALLRLRPFFAIRIYTGFTQEYRQSKMIGDIFVLAKKYNLPVIVHTNKAKKTVQNMFGLDRLLVHPLKFPLVSEQEKITGLRILDGLKVALGIPSESISTGVFGYISQYKGHEEAIFSLRHLPDNYHLFIFGRQHPSSIRKDGGIDPYIERLLSIAVEEGLAGRVHFMGEYEPSEFAGLISAVDVAWLPYREVGQDGSGIASQCLDNAKRVICSASFAFDEVLALDPKPYVRRFDIGNYLQLADATKIVMTVEPRVDSSLDKFTFESQCKLYIDSMGL